MSLGGGPRGLSEASCGTRHWSPRNRHCLVDTGAVSIGLCYRKPCRLDDHLREDGLNPQEVQGLGSHGSLGGKWSSETCVVPKVVIKKYKPTLYQKKCKKGTGFCGNSGVWGTFYTPFGKKPSLYRLVKKGHGAGELNGLPLRAKMLARQTRALGISQTLPSELDSNPGRHGWDSSSETTEGASAPGILVPAVEGAEIRYTRIEQPE